MRIFAKYVEYQQYEVLKPCFQDQKDEDLELDIKETKLV